MPRRHLKRRKSPQVELNLAAMLDMAFQLLAFFILTFRPAPMEGQLGLHLPPPVPIVKPNTKPNDVVKDNGVGDPAVETLDLHVYSDDRGQVSQIKAALRPIVKGALDKANVNSLNQHLKSIFEIQHTPFDRVQLVVDDRLRYEELMKIVDVCTRQTLPNGEKMQRISFVEMKQQ